MTTTTYDDNVLGVLKFMGGPSRPGAQTGPAPVAGLVLNVLLRGNSVSARQEAQGFCRRILKGGLLRVVVADPSRQAASSSCRAHSHPKRVAYGAS